jgi:hypothetical protein
MQPCHIDNNTVPLSGLRTGTTHIEADPEALGCCKALGWQDVENSRRKCNLNERLHRVNEFYRQIFKTLEEDTSKALLPEKLRTQKTLLDTAQKMMQDIINKKPHLRIVSNKLPQTSLALWTLGIMLNWHSDVHVSIMDQHQMALWQPVADQNQVVLLTNVAKLYDVETAWEFDSLVQRVYSYNATLYVEFCKEHAHHDVPVKNAFNHQGFIKERIGYLKNKDPLSYLSPATRSKIRAMEIT